MADNNTIGIYEASSSSLPHNIPVNLGSDSRLRTTQWVIVPLSRTGLWVRLTPLSEHPLLPSQLSLTSPGGTFRGQPRVCCLAKPEGVQNSCTRKILMSLLVLFILGASSLNMVCGDVTQVGGRLNCFETEWGYWKVLHLCFWWQPLQAQWLQNFRSLWRRFLVSVLCLISIIFGSLIIHRSSQILEGCINAESLPSSRTTHSYTSNQLYPTFELN